MSETKTPRTDAKEKSNHGSCENNWVCADFARQLERELIIAVYHLGNMLDETQTTKRGDWPRHLHCLECSCQIRNEPHGPSCKIGQAEKFWGEFRK